mmetsp:Transcript_4075/g.10196  ORF Transcript_4075/g.10196 Transcript_4075/m.10196 type:complete len:209 (+) Transcript_4075:166-792(+)
MPVRGGGQGDEQHDGPVRVRAVHLPRILPGAQGRALHGGEGLELGVAPVCAPRARRRARRPLGGQLVRDEAGRLPRLPARPVVVAGGCDQLRAAAAARPRGGVHARRLPPRPDRACALHVHGHHARAGRGLPQHELRAVRGAAGVGQVQRQRAHGLPDGRVQLWAVVEGGGHCVAVRSECAQRPARPGRDDEARASLRGRALRRADAQ